MKITSVDVFRYELTYNHGVYVMSHGRAQTNEPSLVVKLTTDEGLIGWAETSPHGGTYLPGFFEGELAALGVLGPCILGLDPREPGIIQSAMARNLLAGMGAKSAIDTACWDILGKTTGLPIVTLLGGRLQESFRVWEAVPLGSPEAMADYVRTFLAQGVREFQIKVGNNPHEDARRVDAAMALVNSDVTVIADANGGWNIQSALIAARKMARHGIFLEQPCKSLNNCAEVRRHSDLPLIVDECIMSIDDLVTAKVHAGAGGVNIKLSRVGGLTPARLLRDAATELGMMVTIDETWGGSLVTAALSHLAASTKPDSLLATTFFTEFTTPFIADAPRRRPDGSGAAPSGPGLGIEVDEAALGKPVLRFH